MTEARCFAGLATVGLGLADRRSMVSLLGHRSLPTGCLQGILTTLAKVCGSDCVHEHLHVTVDTSTEQSFAPLELPALEAQLRTEQADRFARVLEDREPFGLSVNGGSLRLADLFVLSPSEALSDSPVWVGLDTAYHAFRCDQNQHLSNPSKARLSTNSGPSKHPKLLAISEPSDPSCWKRCEGVVLIDLDTGEAQSGPQRSDKPVPFILHDGLGRCAEPLQNAALARVPLTLGSITDS